ncbi:helix-turn-helix domain-containing protein [Butyrivibrio proteoclasticus]|uniref:helix-turn-helix domain-containing protein n=1 Tax=Butyrivibrio proteoclasticus TaxID=43305 RepID=UPI00054F4493|nr:helix-turn-helix transcriptional regulator [Butyrivibrio proteoclasticus]
MIKGLNEKLQALRKQYRLSQKDVANAIDVSPSIISGYETGERTPSLENLLALSYLYRCSTDYLLGKEKEIFFETIDTSSLNQLQVQRLAAFIDSLKT